MAVEGRANILALPQRTEDDIGHFAVGLLPRLLRLIEISERRCVSIEVLYELGRSRLGCQIVNLSGSADPLAGLGCELEASLDPRSDNRQAGWSHCCATS